MTMRHHDDRTNARDATLDREPRLTVERVRATYLGEDAGAAAKAARELKKKEKEAAKGN